MGLFSFLFGRKKEQIAAPIQTSKDPISISMSDPRVEEIEKKKKASFPSQNGLYPHEILMLYYAPRYRMDQDNFQGFWKYRYAVDNPTIILRSLAKRGFLRVSTPAENLSKLKSTELKEILQDRGIPSTGKKADLIARICANLSDDDIRKFAPFDGYVLTELGQQELNANEYVLYAHKAKFTDIDVWLLNRLVHDHPNKPYRDLIWADYNGRQMDECLQQMRMGNYSTYRTLRIRQYDFVLEEKRYAEALPLLLEAVYYEVNVESVSSYSISLKYDKPPIASFQSVADEWAMAGSFTIEGFKDLQNKLCLEDEAFVDRMIQIINGFNPPYFALSSKEMAQLILSEMKENKEIATSLYKIAENRIKKDK